ncbi:MAG: hypothetical protein IJ715_02275 [Bacilli bacterium]|nr:hypothetical protein [Bacilli bacterium]
MDELFKQIIMGEKELKELDNSHANMSKKVQNTNEVAKYFLKLSRKNFKDEKIKKRELKKLLCVYNSLIKENKTIKKFINSKDDNKDLLKDAEHVIKLFVDDFTSSKKQQLDLTKEVHVKGYIELLLLMLITVFVSIAFIGNIYLMI